MLLTSPTFNRRLVDREPPVGNPGDALRGVAARTIEYHNGHAFTFGRPIVLEQGVWTPTLRLGHAVVDGVNAYIGDFHIFDFWGLKMSRPCSSARTCSPARAVFPQAATWKVVGHVVIGKDLPTIAASLIPTERLHFCSCSPNIPTTLRADLGLPCRHRRRAEGAQQLEGESHRIGLCPTVQDGIGGSASRPCCGYIQNVPGLATSTTRVVRVTAGGLALRACECGQPVHWRVRLFFRGVPCKRKPSSLAC